jgi:ArsR family transcriptional regulator, arsenate/arsenite/antimonite-responsive transcriptional repressor
MSTKIERHAQQLAALGSPVRLSILRRVVQSGPGGMAVGELQSKLGIPWSTLSHHIERISSAGLLASRPEGKFVLYSADYAALRALSDYLWQDCCKGGAGNCC